eukprot:TRINITY_DN3693_c0_g1_i1.p1 TRINITY_DN3693_c0_g1~~TRINITY_DN3693_c0_g1_i1.p1  ORF type:complete len:216 (+),score=36.06 TRINITY_DN3693_c0_g1_i1:126-773(+)
MCIRDRFRTVDGEGRWLYTIEVYQNDSCVKTKTVRYSQIRGLNNNLEKANTLLGGLKLPPFPSWFRLAAGYTNEMEKKEVAKKMVALEKYLNALAANEICLSTKYFPEFLGFVMPRDRERIVNWINSSKGFVKYNPKDTQNPIKSKVLIPIPREPEPENKEETKKPVSEIPPVSPSPENSQTDMPSAHVLCVDTCLLYTSPSPRDLSTSRMPSSA